MSAEADRRESTLGDRPKVAVGTIVARNYLAFAEVLGRSLAEHHPGTPFFVALADRPHPSAASLEPAEIVAMEALGIPDFERFRAGRTLKELAVSAKPFLLQHLLDRGFQAAIFLDPDTLVVGDLAPVFDEVSSHPVVLTPHLLEPPEGTDRIQRELDLVRAGTFNAGFVGVSNSAVSRRMLSWWQGRLLAACSDDIARGMYFDQRWLDLMQTLFDGVRILRDPGCNIAYWNLPERDLQLRDGQLVVRGGPARFVHFSGFEPANLPYLSRYSRRATSDISGATRSVYEEYAGLLKAAGHDVTSRLPHASAE